MNGFADAGGALGHAADVESESVRRSGWYARYLWVYAAGQLALVPMALLWRGLAAALVLSLFNLTLVSGLSVYAARQRVVRRGFGAAVPLSTVPPPTSGDRAVRPAAGGRGTGRGSSTAPRSAVSG
ncbi:hypothetical protein ACFYT4_25405 [Streptomyces sp. NPDC004609]|uniref:hypothetical protein n=1 Tax=Streptomyces sp. NPDC004609 TaxID=3364704 RepID=UPI0036A311D2